MAQLLTTLPRQLTPMMQQYAQAKAEHPDALMLFRLGDFYEMFAEDAETGSRLLELVLTSREVGKGRRVAMCGVPVHAVDSYLARLIDAGCKVAICEQVGVVGAGASSGMLADASGASWVSGGAVGAGV